MFKLNDYFGGKVMSLGFENTSGTVTIGVMATGEYEFCTFKSLLCKYSRC